MRAAFLALVLLCAGCPHTKRHVGGPVPLPASGDARARGRFDQSRALFERDGASAEAEFAAIARDFPDDPIAPHAELYAGLSAMKGGDYAGAAQRLTKLAADPAVDAALRQRAHLFLGVAETYLGKYPEAAVELAAGQAAVDNQNDDEQAEFHAASAEAAAHAGHLGDAIAHYDAWWTLGQPAERSYVESALRGLVDQLDAKGCEAALAGLGHDGAGRALVGERLAGLYAAAGRGDAAAAVRAKTAAARTALGLVDLGASAGSAAGDRGRLGALLSLTGKRNRVGDLAMRGLALATGAFDGVGGGALFPHPFALSVRDDGSDPARAAAGVDELADGGAIAVVGPVDGRAVEEASVRASALGLPLISLAPAAERVKDAGAATVFHIVHSAERRARALARQAAKAGVVDFAILRPDNRFGEELAAAFSTEVEAQGGHVVVEVSYPAHATSFKDQVSKLKKPWQALFVPDSAQVLELIAPALAAANLVARPVGEKAKQGRPILLLALADAIEPDFLRSAGRYAWGAIVAPGFYADRTDPKVDEFVAAYERSFGTAPTALEAYAFDAARAIDAAIQAGAQTRAEVAARLASQSVAGLTGAVSFGADRRRKDDGILYQVARVENEQYELQPLR